MKQINAFKYEVEPGEVVTVVWTAFRVPDSAIAMAMDEGGLTPTPAHPPTFTFAVTKAVGERHFGAAEGAFPGDTATDAKLESEVFGSKGGRFAGPTIRHSDPPPLRQRDMTFVVVAAGSGVSE